MIHSMTGFATRKGATGAWSWVWDLRAVNGRGLDLRLRVPEWIDGLEAQLRKRLAAAMERGNVSLTLRVSREAEAGAAMLDRAVLDQTLALLSEITHAAEGRGLALAPPSAADLAAMRGVVVAAPQETDTSALSAALLDDLPALLSAFNQMRADEGAALGAVLSDQLDRVDDLIEAARAAVAERADLQRRALAEALARVLDNTDGADPDRVAQELALIAVKTDVREEIDRLTAHVAQARNLLAGKGARGRKLDFLMQEFNREANTLCAKSQFDALTRIGLDLKVLVDQMREQVQNVE